MPQHECQSEQELLAILLSRSVERARFRSDPASWLSARSSDPVSGSGLMSMDHAQLEQQAATLLAKRWRAVRQRLPQSLFASSMISFAVFEDYAGQYWPEGARRHDLDALHFLKYCQNRKLPISRQELAGLQLSLGMRRISLLPVVTRCGHRRHWGLLLQVKLPKLPCREFLIRSI